MPTSPADRPSTDLVPLTAPTAPTVFVVDEIQQLLDQPPADPELQELIRDLLAPGRVNSPTPGDLLRLVVGRQARTVEELGDRTRNES